MNPASTATWKAIGRNSASSTATATRSRTAIYNAKDFDRHIVLDDRTVLTAKKITKFMKESGDRFQKTIVFCVDEEHAARMRQALVNENADLVAENQRYVMRITGSDKEGQEQLGTVDVGGRDARQLGSPLARLARGLLRLR